MYPPNQRLSLLLTLLMISISTTLIEQTTPADVQDKCSTCPTCVPNPCGQLSPPPPSPPPPSPPLPPPPPTPPQHPNTPYCPPPPYKPPSSPQGVPWYIMGPPASLYPIDPTYRPSTAGQRLAASSVVVVVMGCSSFLGLLLLL
ncbi:hypothetical protein QJS04_geneDACA017589 [Acorus gramineus]|uniref:Uncharacterized protein n=1 Tax=Acorus gramineus TaxID=55184 RepID=A0AAV9AWP1_ACOGR|nr:hypothetical protein QJS04_geneDACA017589 [Acorus gramineus]